jgi:glycosyltransferase XagB
MPGLHERLEFLADEPVANPAEFDLDQLNPLIARIVPEDIARVFGVLPVSLRDDVLTVATAQPSDALALRIAHAAASRRGVRAALRVLVIPPEDLQVATDRSFGRATDEDRAIRLGRIADWPPLTPTDRAAAPQTPAPLPVQRPLGELLTAAGHLTQVQLDRALATQARTGDPLGTILTHSGTVGEQTLAEALARQLEMMYVDLDGVHPSRELLELVPHKLMARHRVVPVATQDGQLVLAMVDPLDDAAYTALQEAVTMPMRSVLASDTAVDRILQEVSADDNVEAAVAQLVRHMPDESAYRVLSKGQKRFFIGLLAVAAVLLVVAPIETIIWFNIGSILFYAAFSLYRFSLVYNAIAHDLELPVTEQEVEDLDERALPIYTLLVPLYREAAVLPQLLESIAKLDYPAPRLDVKILVEADDDETIDAFRALRPPPHFKLVVVPDTLPKTKPKACNYGLLHARGEYVVIYDAEDRPEPEQLKKVVVAYQKAPAHVACIQCKLNYYNREQNLLTRWFTTEYSMWFDIYMPGLDASDCPIPLGGTSNHFVTRGLLELGAWDPYNVAEDADLGIRLNKAGSKTAIVDSTTYEEANSDLNNWIRQRSRWVKGYIQTWLVHMRHPIRLFHQLGPRRFVSFQLTVGGTFMSFLLNPLYWGLTTLWVLTEAGLIRSIFPSLIYFAAAAGLILGNFVFVYVNAAGSMQRGYFGLVKYALFSPVYWALMSIGAWKGFLQLFTKPFYWEKTIHGLDGTESRRAAS